MNTLAYAAINTQQPTANSQQPTANSQQPTANSQQPTASSQQPTANSREPLTIGIIDYLNVEPLYYRLEERLGERGIRFRRGVPTELNRALAAGEIDLAPVSCIAAARLADQVAIVPDLAIATVGAVKTVLLASWMADPRELNDCRIALSDESATSVELVKLLAERFWRIQTRYTTEPQDLARMLRRASAALLIGDGALVESAHRREIPGRGQPYIFDLGDEWLKWTGLPFVFAVWAVRRASLDRLRELDVVEALYQTKREGLKHIPEIAQAYAPRLSLPTGVLTKYLHDLRYDLGPAERAGLLTFLTLALPGFTPEHMQGWLPEEGLHPLFADVATAIP